MAVINNNIPIHNPITPGSDDRNEWATHYAKYGAGGFERVADITERNNITSDRRVNKMVYVDSNGLLYKWNAITGVWAEASLGNGSVPQSVLDDIAANKAQIDRLRTDISKVNSLPTYAWRDRGVPTIPDTKYKAYYIHSIVLRDSTSILNIPDNTDEGTIFSVENNDRSDFLTITPPPGETINNLASYKANFDTLNFFVKSGKDWILAYGGVFPNNLSALKSTIQTLLPNSLNSIDEIAAQLKDRLHTFREIQNEFDSQLHTLTELERNGFLKQTMLYGYLDSTAVPTDTSWVINQSLLEESLNFLAQNKGDKYLALAVPVVLEPILKRLTVDNVEKEYTSQYFIDTGTIPRKILITNDKIDSNSDHTVKFEIGIESSGSSGGSGLGIDDGTTDLANITKINFNGAKITELPNQGSMTSGETEITAGLDIHMMAPNQQYGNALCTELIVEPPLQVDDTPTGKFTGKLYLQHDAFEPLHKPGFLAYIAEDTEIVGKIQPGTVNNTAKTHHDGAVYMDNIVKPTGAYLSVDKANKAYTIQEADQLDPNVTGGTDYLLIFRAHMKGDAPDDGFVRIYLYNRSINPFEPTGYLVDKVGNPIVMERHYKAGEELGVIEAAAIVNAKGMQSFTCHVVDNFQDDILILTDRTEGCTGLLIQALTSESKTGDALQQFELDTNQNIHFSSHYLGVDRMNLGWINSRPENPVSYTAGTNFESVNGYRLINYNGIKVGVVDGHTYIQDDGVNAADFNYGKIFSAEETQMLRGKTIHVSATITDKDNGYRVGLMKWTGAPDQFTDKIYSSRNNGSLVFENKWSQVDSIFFSEDIVAGDHTLSKVMTVPSDANNYAIVIYPVSAQIPINLKLKELKVDVNPAFTGYVLHAPELANELHLYYNTEYKQLVQDNQGYAALRYTINATELPSPVGILGKGAADISLDTTVNKVNDSGAKGGEGAIVFNKDGDVIFHTQIRLSSEKATGTKSEINFWYAKVIGEAGSETYDEITPSVTSFEVAGGAKNVIYRMNSFKIQVTAGDRIALRMQGNSADAAFIQSNSPSTPMISTSINYQELVTSEDEANTTYYSDFNSEDFNISEDNKISINRNLGLDLSSFDTQVNKIQYAVKNFTNVDHIDIPVVIPDGIRASIENIYSRDSDGTVRPILNVDFRYKNDIFTIHWGSLKTGEIIIAFYK